MKFLYHPVSCVINKQLNILLKEKLQLEKLRILNLWLFDPWLGSISLTMPATMWKTIALLAKDARD